MTTLWPGLLPWGEEEEGSEGGEVSGLQAPKRDKKSQASRSSCTPGASCWNRPLLGAHLLPLHRPLPGHPAPSSSPRSDTAPAATPVTARQTSGCARQPAPPPPALPAPCPDHFRHASSLLPDGCQVQTWRFQELRPLPAPTRLQQRLRPRPPHHDIAGTISSGFLRNSNPGGSPEF